MQVNLVSATPLRNIILAARTSHDSRAKSDTPHNNLLGPTDTALLRRLIKLGHDSVLEHVVYTFDITGISRALLQELVRHRIASYTVQSTRYTLGKILSEYTEEEIISNFCVIPQNEHNIFIEELSKIVHALKLLYMLGLENDKLKYLLPECWKTNVVMTVNARELMHILELRLSSKALWEFQELARLLLEEVKQVHPQLWELIRQERGIGDESNG